MSKSIDIEAAVADALIFSGWEACAPPLPDTFERLPHVMVTRTGGYRKERAIDIHRVSVDVRAKTWGDVTAAANMLVGEILDFEYTDLGGAYCHSVKITTLPYQNLDPRHRDIPRMTFAVEFVTGIDFS